MANRAKIFVRLGLLLGLPLAILGGIFGGGIYCGTQHRARVLGFERDVLGMDVAVPADEATPPPPAASPSPAEPAPSPAAPAPAPAVASPAAALTIPNPAPSPAVPPASADELPVARPEPVEDEDLAARLATLRTVTVKVLVDPTLFDDGDAWIAEAARLVRAASSSYRTLAGIELSLVAVGRWPVNAGALTPEQLRADLRARPREGADILLGLTDREEAGAAGASTADGDRHGACAVVFSRSRERSPHLRPLLRELGHLLGAADVTDPESEAYQLGSFMSLAPVPEGAAPWLDGDSRRRVLERKDLPFEEEP